MTVFCAAAMIMVGCTSTVHTDSTQSTLTTPNPSSTGPATGGTGELIAPDEDDEETAQTDGSSLPSDSASIPPAAATLPWLTGAADDDGLQATIAGEQRWVGRTPGEYAIFDGDEYHYFGPDGSMVGCASRGSCVGVDSSGNVAVTPGPHSPRDVYLSSGEFVGRYTFDGDVLSSAPLTSNMDDAIAASGVNVAAMVNSATLRVPFAGGATGDPHVVTAGGVRMTTQSVGQFVARAGDPEHSIQLEFAPMAHRDDVSIVSQVAISTGDDTVIVDANGALTIQGDTRARSAEFEQIELANSVLVGRWPADSDAAATSAAAVVVLWPDGVSVSVLANPALGLTVVAHLYPVEGAQGLFGAVGKLGKSDLIARRGTEASTSTAVASWRVRKSERLLPEPPSPTTFPESIAKIDSGARKVGENACTGQGFASSQDIAACAFDVGLTGDTGFVAGHAAMAVPADAPPVALPFAARWPALRAGSVTMAPDLPADGRLDIPLAPGASSFYHIPQRRAGEITLINRSGCAEGANPPGINQAAMRVFTMNGRAVSDRFPLCGHSETPALPAGDYALIVANGSARPAMDTRVDVELP